MIRIRQSVIIIGYIDQRKSIHDRSGFPQDNIIKYEIRIFQENLLTFWHQN